MQERLNGFSGLVMLRKQHVLREIAALEQKILEIKEELSNFENVESRFSNQNYEKEFISLVRNSLCDVINRRNAELNNKILELMKKSSNLAADTSTLASKLGNIESYAKKSPPITDKIQKTPDPQINPTDEIYHDLLEKIEVSEEKMRNYQHKHEKLKNQVKDYEQKVLIFSKNMKKLTEKIENKSKSNSWSIAKYPEFDVDIKPSMRKLVPDRGNIVVLAPIKSLSRRSLRF